MQLDYSALNEPVTSADVSAFKAARPHNHRYAAIIVFSLFGLLGTALIIATLVDLVFHHTADPGMVTYLGILVIAAIGSRIAIQIQYKKLAKVYKFATANRLWFVQELHDPSYQGVIFSEGYGRMVSTALVFPDGTEIGNYQYTTGAGKTQEVHYWGYVRIKLARRLPNMVLDAKKNNTFRKFSNLPESFNRGQILSLEGDFDKYFTLYAPKEYETDALYVFTPDVMATLIDAGASYDMEVVDDNLMLYKDGAFKLDSQPELETLLTIISKIGTEIRDQSNYYADDRIANHTANIVAAPGQRLKSRARLTTVIIVAIIFAAVAVLFYFQLKSDPL